MLRVIDDIHLSEVGNALRDTLGEENQFPPKDMGEAIKYSNEVAFSDGYGSGFEEGEEFGYNTGFADGDELGYQAGLEQGYNSGKADGIEEGKKAQYDEFWNMYQANGTRVDYKNAFCSTYWNEKTFKPKYDIKPTNAYGLFGYFSRRHSYNCDLVELLNKCGVKLDTSNTTDVKYMFENARIYRIPELDLRKVTTLESMFRSDLIETIDKIILNDTGNQIISIAFLNCTALKNIEFEGVIGQDFDIKWSPLSIASLKNIIEHLKDYNGTANEYKYTVTFKTSAFNAIEAEGATAEYNGTACTWAELIGFKKWNLVKA